MYLFYGENDLSLYVGKSTHIKQRVLSRFLSDHRHNKEMSLSQQLRRIEYIETAGEIGALLKFIIELNNTFKLNRYNLFIFIYW